LPTGTTGPPETNSDNRLIEQHADELVFALHRREFAFSLGELARYRAASVLGAGSVGFCPALPAMSRIWFTQREFPLRTRLQEARCLFGGLLLRGHFRPASLWLAPSATFTIDTLVCHADVVEVRGASSKWASEWCSAKGQAGEVVSRTLTALSGNWRSGR